MNRRALFWCALTGILLATTACGGAPAKTATPEAVPAITPSPAISQEPRLRGVVTLWHSWEEPQLTLFLQILDAFQAQNPGIQFDVLYVSAERLRTQFAEAAMNGAGPAVILGPAEWGPPLYDAGLLADLNGLVSAGLLPSLNQAALGSGRYRGALVSLPYRMEGVVLFRNVSLVPEVPATFDDLVLIAKSVASKDVRGAILERSFLYSGGHLPGIGGRWVDENGAPAFNDAKGLEWLTLLQAFDRAGPTVFQSDEDFNQFKDGTVGFIIDGTWNMQELSDALGPDTLAIDPWPAAEGGALSGFVNSENIFLSSRAAGDDRRAALRFIEYFLSSEAQSLLAASGNLPVAAGVELPEENGDLMKQALVALAGGTTYPVVPDFDAFPSRVDAALSSVLRGRVSPGEALQKASEEIRSAQQGVTPTP